MRTVGQKTASQVALRNCPKRWGGGQCLRDLGEGGTCNPAHVEAEGYS